MPAIAIARPPALPPSTANIDRPEPARRSQRSFRDYLDDANARCFAPHAPTIGTAGFDAKEPRFIRADAPERPTPDGTPPASGVRPVAAGPTTDTSTDSEASGAPAAATATDSKLSAPPAETSASAASPAPATSSLPESPIGTSGDSAAGPPAAAASASVGDGRTMPTASTATQLPPLSDATGPPKSDDAAAEILAQLGQIRAIGARTVGADQNAAAEAILRPLAIARRVVEQTQTAAPIDSEAAPTPVAGESSPRANRPVPAGSRPSVEGRSLNTAQLQRSVGRAADVDAIGTRAAADAESPTLASPAAHQQNVAADLARFLLGEAAVRSDASPAPDAAARPASAPHAPTPSPAPAAILHAADRAMPIASAAGGGELDHLVRVLDSSAGDRSWHVSLRLDPPELGRLHVQARMIDGGLTLNVVADSDAVRRIVESRMSELREALGERGVRLDAADVRVRTPDANAAPREHANGGNSTPFDRPAQQGHGFHHGHGTGDNTPQRAPYAFDSEPVAAGATAALDGFALLPTRDSSVDLVV